MPLSVVILAAGQGKRMNSDLRKCCSLGGAAASPACRSHGARPQPRECLRVYGHGGAQVQEALSREAVEWVLQSEQLGTGHAVMQAMCVIRMTTRCWCSTATCR